MSNVMEMGSIYTGSKGWTAQTHVLTGDWSSDYLELCPLTDQDKLARDLLLSNPQTLRLIHSEWKNYWLNRRFHAHSDALESQFWFIGQEHLLGLFKGTCYELG